MDRKSLISVTLVCLSVGCFRSHGLEEEAVFEVEPVAPPIERPLPPLVMEPDEAPLAGVDPTRGAYASSDHTLYRLVVPSGEVERVLESSVALMDIAVLDGALYAVTVAGTLMELDPRTGEVERVIAPLDDSLGIAMGQEGSNLLLASFDQVYRFDPNTSETSLLARVYPPWSVSGDIAILDDQILITLKHRSRSHDTLGSINALTGELSIIANLPDGCIWGLLVDDAQLYGATCDGLVLRIDPRTGESEQVSQTDARFWGATSAL